jgi:hypothetical protein
MDQRSSCGPLECVRLRGRSDERSSADGPGVVVNGIALLRAAERARSNPNYPCVARPASLEHE